MKYQIADLINGPFGDIYYSLEEAETALIHEIEEGQKWNIENTPEGFPVPDASLFFYIVQLDFKPNAQHYDVPKTSNVHFRLTALQKYDLKRRAKLEGLTLSAYILQELGLGVHVEHVE